MSTFVSANLVPIQDHKMEDLCLHQHLKGRCFKPKFLFRTLWCRLLTVLYELKKTETHLCWGTQTQTSHTDKSHIALSPIKPREQVSDNTLLEQKEKPFAFNDTQTNQSSSYRVKQQECKSTHQRRDQRNTGLLSHNPEYYPNISRSLGDPVSDRETVHAVCDLCHPASSQY